MWANASSCNTKFTNTIEQWLKKSKKNQAIFLKKSRQSLRELFQEKNYNSRTKKNLDNMRKQSIY